MGQQGTYPIGSRTPTGADTLTAVVTGATADLPISTLQLFLQTAFSGVFSPIAALPTFIAGLASSSGASEVGYEAAGGGAVATTVQAKLQESVSVKDFGAKGYGITDDTAAIQAAINSCSSNTQYGAPSLYIPAGTYKITSSLVLPKQFINIHGDGPWATQISFTGVTGGCITSASQAYLQPFIRDIAFVGDTTSGYAIDFSAVTTEVYLGELRNLYLQAGLDGLYAPRFFSMVVQNVSSYSYNGHCFRVQCGPGVSWISCYALTSGSGKAGYRLGGLVSMYSCNGVNTSDYWGVFGNDTTSTDGFQSDFASNDIPDINLYGCNIENFGSISTVGEGIRIQNAFRNLNVIGGIIDRSGLATAFSAFIHCRGLL